MVEDPNLVNHLAHFGIKVAMLEKVSLKIAEKKSYNPLKYLQTEKSMVELELDLNQRVGEWNILTESNSNLVPISGAGYTGMRNLGNSCYLNSVMQVGISMKSQNLGE